MSYKYLLLSLACIMAIGLAVVLISRTTIEQEDSNTTSKAENVDAVTSDTQTVPDGKKLHVSDEFGFSIMYPSRYEVDPAFSLWSGKTGLNGGAYEFGINAQQESLIVIRAYEIDAVPQKVNDLLKSAGRQIQVNSDVSAMEVEDPDINLIIQRADRVFTIKSAYYSKEDWAEASRDLAEFQEFQETLSSLRIF